MADVDSAGVRIHYEFEGEGPPLLLMHGMGGSVDNCRRPVLEHENQRLLGPEP